MELESEDPYLRGMAAAVLGESPPERSERAFRALLPHAHDPNAKTREHVHAALVKLAERDFLTWLQDEDGLSFLPGMEPFVADAITTHRVEAARMLVDGLGQRRRAAFEGAGKLLPLCGEAAVEPLAKLLEQSTRPGPLARAVRALGAIGTQAKSTTPALIQLTKHPSPVVRRAALDALFSIDRYGTETRQALRPLLDDPDPDVRARAACVDVLDVLDDWGKASARERSERVRRLRENESAVPVLIEELNAPRLGRCKRAFMLLSLLSGEGAVAGENAAPTLPAEDAPVAARARFAWDVGRNVSNDRAAVERIKSYLGDPEPSVRVCAVLAFGRLGRIQPLSERKPQETSELVGHALQNTMRSLIKRKRQAAGSEGG